MTENKRFDYEGKYVTMDNGVFVIAQTINDAELITKTLNELYDENEQLKKEYNKLKHRHSLLHDECIEAECDRDGYHKDVLSLEKENEQLKKEKEELKDGLQEFREYCNYLKSILEDNEIWYE